MSELFLIHLAWSRWSFRNIT